MTDKEKFTPGPWTYDGGFTVFSEGDEWPVCDLISDTEIDGEMYILPYKENAALIAAAPTMYQVLKHVAGILREKEYPYVARQGVALVIDSLLKHVSMSEVKNDGLRD